LEKLPASEPFPGIGFQITTEDNLAWRSTMPRTIQKYPITPIVSPAFRLTQAMFIVAASVEFGNARREEIGVRRSYFGCLDFARHARW